MEGGQAEDWKTDNSQTQQERKCKFHESIDGTDRVCHYIPKLT